MTDRRTDWQRANKGRMATSLCWRHETEKSITICGRHWRHQHDSTPPHWPCCLGDAKFVADTRFAGGTKAQSLFPARGQASHSREGFGVRANWWFDWVVGTAQGRAFCVADNKVTDIVTMWRRYVLQTLHVRATTGSPGVEDRVLRHTATERRTTPSDDLPWQTQSKAVAAFYCSSFLFPLRLYNNLPVHNGLVYPVFCFINVFTSNV